MNWNFESVSSALGLPLIDSAKPVQVTRGLPIEQLTPIECKTLLVHSDESNTPERRHALWEKWSKWFESPDGMAWDKAQIAKRNSQ